MRAIENSFFKVDQIQKELILEYYAGFKKKSRDKWNLRIKESKDKFNRLIETKKGATSFNFNIDDIKELLKIIQKLSNLDRAASWIIKSIEQKKLNLTHLNQVLFNLYNTTGSRIDFYKNLLDLRNFHRIGLVTASQFACYFDNEKNPLFTMQQWDVITQVFNFSDWIEEFVIQDRTEFFWKLPKHKKKFLYKIFVLTKFKEYLNEISHDHVNFFTLNQFLWDIYDDKGTLFQKETEESIYEEDDIAEQYSTTKERGYKEVEIKLIDSLPYPLASILWAYKAEIDSEHKVDRLFHFFEALSQFISIILLSGFATDQEFFKQECKTMKSIDDEWFRRPTFSSWNQICMWLSKSFRRIKEDSAKYKKLRKIFGNPDDSFITAITNKNLCKILEEVREYRNIWKGHTGIVSAKEIKTRLDKLEEKIMMIEDIISNFFSRLLLISPISSEYIKKVYNYKVEIIMGTRRPFMKIIIETMTPMEKDMLYMINRGEITPIELIPLVRLMESPKTEQVACYFYNRVDKDKARWISYHYEPESEIIKPEDELKSIFKFLKTDVN